jgi:hypothetical protein
LPFLQQQRVATAMAVFINSTCKQEKAEQANEKFVLLILIHPA